MISMSSNLKIDKCYQITTYWFKIIQLPIVEVVDKAIKIKCTEEDEDSDGQPFWVSAGVPCLVAEATAKNLIFF